MAVQTDAVAIAERAVGTEPVLQGETESATVDRRETHGVGRNELSPPAPVEFGFTWAREGERTSIHARGDVVREGASELAAFIHHISPEEHPNLTLDLREATSLDPLVLHALMHAWEKRNRTLGCIRIHISPGPVAYFLANLNLTNVLDVVQVDEDGEPEDGPAAPHPDRKDLAQELLAAIAHYQAMHRAVRDRDLAALRKTAGESTCANEASLGDGAEPTPGRWSEPSALRAQYGGAEPLVAHVLRDAELGNWDAAELLVLSLIAEASGTISADEPHLREGPRVADG